MPLKRFSGYETKSLNVLCSSDTAGGVEGNQGTYFEWRSHRQVACVLSKPLARAPDTAKAQGKDWPLVVGGGGRHRAPEVPFLVA